MIDMSKQKTTIKILVDGELIKEAESVFQKFDVNVESAIQLFLEQAVEEQKLPFDRGISKKETLQATNDVGNNNNYG
ncbi:MULTISPECIES: type II toxin-antitoxin system RelB/DinJ family antitoxin [Enterococcus]|nr:type II toxin-antitoxin system RelB/DinJ family antitoxin [Enterococcus faecalis]UTJ09141.1 type II toxin-antitoxin system RelB/DinJ family antitoxin [Enterococcus faecalis]